MLELTSAEGCYPNEGQRGAAGLRSLRTYLIVIAEQQIPRGFAPRNDKF